MRVVFWSNAHGQTGCSTNMLALSIMNAFQTGERSIFFQTGYRFNRLESFLLKQNEIEDTSNFGLDVLIRNIQAGKADYEILKNCSLDLWNQKIAFLPGPVNRNREIYEGELAGSMSEILELTNKTFDWVFVDVKAGVHPLSLEIIQEADCRVVNLCQNKKVLDDYLEHYQNDYKKDFYIIGNYDPKSNFNLANLRRQYRFLTRKNSAILPYHTAFRDAGSAASILLFLMQNQNCDRKDSNYYFMTELKNTAVHFRSFLGMDRRDMIDSE